MSEDKLVIEGVGKDMKPIWGIDKNMPKIHKDPYLVISGYNASNLKNLVINAINNGYEPCGGLASNAMGDLFQAMVLKEMVK